MAGRSQELLLQAVIEEIRGLRSDLQDLKAALTCTVVHGLQPVRAGHREARPLLTVAETAELLRTSRKGVYGMLERGQIPGVVRLGRKILVRRDKLMRFLSRAEGGW